MYEEQSELLSTIRGTDICGSDRKFYMLPGIYAQNAIMKTNDLRQSIGSIEYKRIDSIYSKQNLKLIVIVNNVHTHALKVKSQIKM